MLLKQEHDLRLLCSRLWGPAAAAAGADGREQHWRGAALVAEPGIGPAGEQRPHGCGATGAYRAVQRSNADLVECIRIGPRLDEAGDSRLLSMRIPRIRFRHADCR